MDEELDIIAIRRSVNDDLFLPTPREERQRDPWNQGVDVCSQSADVDHELENTDLFV